MIAFLVCIGVVWATEILLGAVLLGVSLHWRVIPGCPALGGICGTYVPQK